MIEIKATTPLSIKGNHHTCSSNRKKERNYLISTYSCLFTHVWHSFRHLLKCLLLPRNIISKWTFHRLRVGSAALLCFDYGGQIYSAYNFNILEGWSQETSICSINTLLSRTPLVLGLFVFCSQPMRLGYPHQRNKLKRSHWKTASWIQINQYGNCEQLLGQMVDDGKCQASAMLPNHHRHLRK